MDVTHFCVKTLYREFFQFFQFVRPILSHTKLFEYPKYENSKVYEEIFRLTWKCIAPCDNNTPVGLALD